MNVVAIESVGATPSSFEPPAGLPPARPREIDLPIRSMPGGWVLVIVGGAFTAVAMVFIVVGVGMVAANNSTGLFFTLFPLIHFAVGLALLGFGLGRRAKRRRIYREGAVAMATIEGVGLNRSVSVNGRNPFELVWVFELDGHRYHDKHSSFDERATSFVPGDRIWVLYDPDDPEESVEWPPLVG